jgi:lipopolysaccharide heptosyltransferase I
MTINSVLIVRLSAIGDVIHALPVVDVIRSQMPNARIGWVVEELSAPLLANHPAIDKVYIVPRKQWKGKYHRVFFSDIKPYFNRVAADGWDAVVDMQGLLKSGMAARLSGAPLRIGFKGKNSRELNWLFQNKRIAPLDQDHHVVQQNLRLIEGLGLTVPETIPPGTIGITGEEKEAMANKLCDAGWGGEPLLAINAAAGFPSKVWPVEHYTALGRMISEDMGFRPIIFWGPGEEELRDSLVEGLKGVEGFAAPPTTIRESVVLTAYSSFYIGCDTGPSQIAGCMGIPCVTVFGSTDPVRNCPWPGTEKLGNSITVRRDDLSCVGCWNRRCPLKDDELMKCMKGLSPEKVFEEISPLLAKIKTNIPSGDV